MRPCGPAIRAAYEKAALEDTLQGPPKERAYTWTDPEARTPTSRQASIDVTGISKDLVKRKVRECEDRSVDPTTTCGERARLLAERDAWIEAGIVDERVKRLRAQARAEADAAVPDAEAGDLQGARGHAQAARRLQVQAGLRPTWGILEDAIDAAIRTTAERAAPGPGLDPELQLRLLGTRDRAEMDRALDALAGLLERPAAADALGTWRDGLERLRQGVEDVGTDGARPEDVRALAGALSVLLATRLGLRWVVVEDEGGWQIALQDGAQSLLVFPLGAIERSLDGGERPSLERLLEELYVVTPPGSPAAPAS